MLPIDGWACEKCTLHNESSVSVCGACRTGKLGLKGGRVETAIGDVVLPIAAPTAWTCGACTVRNEMLFTKCSMCGADRPAVAAVPGVAVAGAGAVPVAANAPTPPPLAPQLVDGIALLQRALGSGALREGVAPALSDVWDTTWGRLRFATAGPVGSRLVVGGSWGPLSSVACIAKFEGGTNWHMKVCRVHARALAGGGGVLVTRAPWVGGVQVPRHGATQRTRGRV